MGGESSKVGRPRICDDGVAKVFTVRLPPDLAKRLKDASGKTGQHSGEIIREGITRELKRLDRKG